MTQRVDSCARMRPILRYASISFFLFGLVCVPSPVMAVEPPSDGEPLPAHVREAQRELAESYGDNGIARRLREIKHERELRAKAGITSSPAIVSFNVPVLLGSYSDNANIFTPADFDELLFGANPTGSMADYYDEISYGQFLLSGISYGPFTAAETQAYYTNGDNGLGDDYPTNAAGFVTSLLSAADASIDFSQYDSDGPDGLPNSGDDDGYVDAIIVAAADGGVAGGNIWPHAAQMSRRGGAAFVTNDPAFGGGFILADMYTIQPSERGNGSLDTIKTIGTYCHEFGHVLGLPDLYDTDNSTNGVGTWCLMGLGNNGASGGASTSQTPVHMSAWCKVYLGWVEPTVVNGVQAVLLPPVETTPTIYKLWDDAYQGGRYFLFENRTATGFDTDIYGEGVLVWHCNDEVVTNSYEGYRIIDLEEADGNDDLDLKNNSMDSGDPFPGTSGNTNFDDLSYPSAHDVFDSPTGASASGFAYTAGPGSDVSVTLSQRELSGYTITYHGRSQMDGWGFSTPEINHGAVRFVAPEDGNLVAIQAGVFANTPTDFVVRVFDDMVGTTPQGLQSTTVGSFPSYPNRRHHEIQLSAPLALTNGQTFLIDVGWGPDDYAVPFTSREPFSGQSYYSNAGSSYTQWMDKDVLIRARVSACVCPFQDDFDEDGFITALDLAQLIDILFAGKPDLKDASCPAPRGDDDCDGFTTALDLAYKIDHLFAGGDRPCDPCAP